VAMTRAKDELNLIVPQRFFTHQQANLGDRHVYASRSRFIPDSILPSFRNAELAGSDRWSRQRGRRGSRSTLLRV
jgi:DNA helicase-2/ATP-dependent DNA helicase PcrA